MIKIDLHSRQPIYEQLKEQVIKLSMLGLMEKDEKLPSVRSLAREIGINPNTVQKAYQELEREGLIYTVSGKGSFISSDEKVRPQIQKKSLEEVTTSARRAAEHGCTKEEILLAAEAGTGEQEEN